MAGITKLDMLHTEDNFISQIAELKRRISALERQAIKLDEDDFVLPTGGVNIRNGFLTLGDPGYAVISGDAIVINKSYYLVETEGGAGADNLDRITGGVDGALLVLQAADSTHTVTLRDIAGGNLVLDVAGNFALTHAADTITLIYNETLGWWCEIARSDNAA